jgi:hypothetical protein
LQLFIECVACFANSFPILTFFDIRKGRKMATSERLKTIDSQINKLQSRKKKLEEKRKNQITTILNRCGANKMSDEVLAGAVLEAVRAFNQNDKRISTWQTEGSKILRPGRGKKKFI